MSFGKQCYDAAADKGFHDKERSFAEAVMLIITEIYEWEACSAPERSEKIDAPKTEEELADIIIRVADCLYEFFSYDTTHFEIEERPYFCNWTRSLAKAVQIHRAGGARGEVITCLLDVAQNVYRAMDTGWGTIEAKLAYNKTRPHLHGKKY